MTTPPEPSKPPWPSEGELVRLLEAMRQFTQECQRCQATLPIDWQYCAQCGVRLASHCPSCNHPLPPAGGRFCPHCGFEILTVQKPRRRRRTP